MTEAPVLRPDSRLFARTLYQLGYFPLRIVGATKRPAVRGYSGHTRPPREQILADIEAMPYDAPLAISLPLGVCGIDVDSYRHGDAPVKSGGESLCALEAELGPLPPTWMSTRRGPQSLTGPTRTGIYLFQLPQWAVQADGEELVKLVSAPAPGIETIQYHERYVVCAPTVLDGMSYRWYAQLGSNISESELPPPVKALPVLPVEWVQYLYRSGLSDADGMPIASGLRPITEFMRTWTRQESDGRSNRNWRAQHARQRHRDRPSDSGGATVGEALSGFAAYSSMDLEESLSWAAQNIPGWHEPPNAFLDNKIREFEQQFGDGTSRHDLTRDMLWHVLWLCVGDRRNERPGNPGGDSACRQISECLIRARDDDEGGRSSVVRDEIARMMVHAVAKLRAEVESGGITPAEGTYGESRDIDVDFDYEGLESFISGDNGEIDVKPYDDTEIVDGPHVEEVLKIMDRLDVVPDLATIEFFIAAEVNNVAYRSKRDAETAREV